MAKSMCHDCGLVPVPKKDWACPQCTANFNASVDVLEQEVMRIYREW